LKYMTPVVILSDGYIANGSEAWRIPSIDELPEITAEYFKNAEKFHPYQRDSKTLARPWAIPGTPGLEHRVGGLEKEDITGDVDQSPENHEKMTKYRAEKVMRVQDDIPPLEIEGDKEADLLVVGWGSTYGAITRAVMELNDEGISVASVHLRHLSPLPRDLGDILKRYKRVLVPENNLGQLWTLLRATYLVDAELLSKVTGVPFKISEIETKIREMVGA